MQRLWPGRNGARASPHRLVVSTTSRAPGGVRSRRGSGGSSSPGAPGRPRRAAGATRWWSTRERSRCSAGHSSRASTPRAEASPSALPFVPSPSRSSPTVGDRIARSARRSSGAMTTSHSVGWGHASVSYLLAAPPAATTVVGSRPMPLRTHGPSCGVRTVRSACASSSPTPRRASSRLLIEVRDRPWCFRLWVVGAGRRQTALGVSRPERVCISVRARYTERLQWRSPRPPGMANHRAPPTTPAPNRH
jgi:hypothetical protein